MGLGTQGVRRGSRIQFYTSSYYRGPPGSSHLRGTVPVDHRFKGVPLKLLGITYIPTSNYYMSTIMSLNHLDKINGK